MKFHSLLLPTMLCLSVNCLAEEGAVPKAAAGSAAIPSAELTASIRARGQAVFDAAFETCDLATLRTLVADDMEFYHDQGGVVARSGDEFVAAISKRCDGQKAPDSYRSRRELVEDSLEVHPVPGYGAMEAGTHRFYERKGDGPESLAGIAKYAHVWQQVNGEWKLSRVMSYGHRPAL